MYLMQGKPFLVSDETLLVRRYDRTYGTDVHVVDGLRVFDEAPYRAFRCTGSVQPISGRDIEQPAEGTYQTARLVWFVWMDGPDFPQTGDFVERDGVYLVTASETWGSYVRCELSTDDKLDGKF